MDSRHFPSRAAWLILWAAWLIRPASGFDSDGVTDIVWSNANSPTNQGRVWLMSQLRWFQNTLAMKSTEPLVSPGGSGWQVAATADFNRDGQTDILWRKPLTGENSIALLKGSTTTALFSIWAGDTNYYVVGTGDFNHDGYADILWRHSTLDLTAVWFMTGVIPAGITFLPSFGGTSARAAAIGDFNNDGNPDILWQDPAEKKVTVWYMNGTERLASARLEVYPSDSPNWRLMTTGMFNSVGTTDLVWHNSDGSSAIWVMRNTTFLRGVLLPPQTDPNWQISGTGGYANAMTLGATAVAAPPSLTLSWRFGESPLPSIQRRTLGSSSWSVLTNDYLPRRFTDTNIAVGQRYEYLIGGTNYLLAAVNGTPDPLENGRHGTVILIIDRTVADPLAAELNLLRTNLVGDGWAVIRTNVPRHDDRTWANNTNAIASIKAFLRNAFTADPNNVKAAFLIGHVPMPYSGCGSPDHHLPMRTFPADGYYADFEGVYHDTSTNCAIAHLESRQDNIPADGKWDENQFPGQLRLAVGRVDFAKMPALKLAGESDSQAELRLLRQYLRKDDRYRRKLVVLENRVVVGSFFDGGPTDFYYPKLFQEALKSGSRVVGFAPESIVEGDCLAPQNGCLWGVLGGSGATPQIQGTNFAFHFTADLANPASEPHAGFVCLFGSYLLDFDSTNSILRAVLGTPNYGLGAMWVSGFSWPVLPRHTLSFEQLGLGETIGSAVQRSINNAESVTQNIFVTLLGDPTLRWQILTPPAHLSASSGPNVALRWASSAEANQYFVYRSQNGLDGPWTKVSRAPVAGTTYTDTGAPPGPKTYQVRALKLVVTSSGSYTNLSQGLFVSTPN